MSLEASIKTLATIKYTNVRRSYTLDDIRGGLVNPSYPCLIPIPTTGVVERQAMGFVTSAFEETHTIRHRYLHSPMQAGQMETAIVETVQFIDYYLQVIQTQASHAGAQDIRVVSYESGSLDWSNESYFGCDFLVEVEVCD